MDLTESPRSGAGDSISSSNISKAITATSSSPEARHCLAACSIPGMKSLNLTYIKQKPKSVSSVVDTLANYVVTRVGVSCKLEMS